MRGSRSSDTMHKKSRLEPTRLQLPRRYPVSGDGCLLQGDQDVQETGRDRQVDRLQGCAAHRHRRWILQRVRRKIRHGIRLLAY